MKILYEVSGFGDFHLSFEPKPNPNPALDSAANPNPKPALDSVSKPNPKYSVSSSGLVGTAFKDRGPTAKSNLASFRFLTMYIKVR